MVGWWSRTRYILSNTCSISIDTISSSCLSSTLYPLDCIVQQCPQLYILPFSFTFCEDLVKLIWCWLIFALVSWNIYCFLFLPCELSTPAFLLEITVCVLTFFYLSFLAGVKYVFAGKISFKLFSWFQVTMWAFLWDCFTITPITSWL